LGDIAFKCGDDPVTIADKEAEKELTNRLLGLLPASKVVGEEAFASNNGILAEFSGESPVWIIDPLDGTKAFVASDPVYGVIVALAEQNQTIAGILYDPTSKEAVMAEKGAGAYFKGKKLSALPPAPLQEMKGILGLRLREPLEGDFQEAVEKGPRYTRMLSACHDYASLVVDEPHFARRLDGRLHFHSTYATCTPWDNAAGILIHAEAGGYTAHWNGKPFRPGDYDCGVLSAPDKDSWMEIRSWVSTFRELPHLTQ
jgi:fructose-1,6-bisphosphatase/inositol monophosphatase family enzyme